MRYLTKKLSPAVVVFWIWAGVVQGQTPEANSAKTGSISGSVTSTSGNLPINTTVYVGGVNSLEPPRSAVVETDGTFKVENLEFGVYRVWAGAPGFVVQPQPAASDSRAIYHTGDSANIVLRKAGVITGKVVNSINAPVVAASVRAYRVRDENGKAIEIPTGFLERMTDDRGIYRLYGLFPGTYIVSAGGMSRFFGGFGATGFDQEVPTFAPSSTRDTAMEVIVRSGDEATVDIQYRGEPGHGISGSVQGILQSGGMIYSSTINLTDVKTRTTLVSSSASAASNYSFAFYGLADGEYELVAQQYSQSRDLRASNPKRVKVLGADVTGVSLLVAPLPAITGRVILDSSEPAACVKRRAAAFQETMVTVRRQKQPARATESAETSLTDPVPLNSLEQIADAVPEAKGDFILRNLRPGTYRVGVQLPSWAWYVGSLTLNPGTRGSDTRVVSDGIGLKTSISGLSITISEGAATVRGRLTAGEGQRLPERSFVYLVPSEKENASELLRYFEASVGGDGNFALNNIPPGEYLIVGLKADGERSGIVVRQDAGFRATVVREAEKSKQSISLKACERIDDFEVPFSVTSKP